MIVMFARGQTRTLMLTHTVKTFIVLSDIELSDQSVGLLQKALVGISHCSPARGAAGMG